MKAYVRSALLVSVFAVVLTGANRVHAQILPGDTDIESASAAYFEFLRTGEVPIEVSVIGDVGAPGIYAVGIGTGLANLLALSRGFPSSSGRSSNEVMVRLYQDNGSERRLTYEQSIQDVLTGVPPHPPLASEDVVLVEMENNSSWLTVDNVLRVVSTVGTLLLVYDRFRN